MNQNYVQRTVAHSVDSTDPFVYDVDLRTRGLTGDFMFAASASLHFITSRCFSLVRPKVLDAFPGSIV